MHSGPTVDSKPTTPPPSSPPPSVPSARTLVRCARHRTIDAAVVCDRCHVKWCFDCVTAGDERGVKWWLCKCSGRCNPLVDEQERAARRVFERRAFDVFAYPIRGEGKWLLLVGAFFFGFFDLFFGSGLRALLEMVATAFQPAANGAGNSGTLSFGMVQSSFAIALAVAFLGVQLSWVMTVVRDTAKGRDEPPGFPDYTTFVESTLLPTWRVVAALALFVGPGVVVLALPLGVFSLLLGLLLVVAGVAALPMALTSIAIADSLGGLDVPRILRSIRTVGLPYLGVAALFFAVLGLLFAGTTSLSFTSWLAPFLRAAVAVYFAAVAGRVLGILYGRYEKELGWYSTAHETARR